MKLAALVLPAALFAYVVNGVPVRAQEQPTLSLTQALDEASRRNPEIRVATRSVDIARAAVIGAVPSPLQAQASQGVGKDVPGGVGTLQTLTAGVTQELSLQTGARRAAALAGVDVASAQLTSTRRDVETRVVNAYYALGSAAALVQAALESVNNAREVEAAAKLRQKVGAVGSFEVLRIDIEVRRAQTDLLRARAGERSARIALNALLARSLETATKVALEAGASVSSDRAALYQAAERIDPQVAALRASIAQAVAQERAARLGYAPVLTLGAGYQVQRAPLTASTSSGPAASAALSFPLLDYGSLRAAVREAQARSSVAEAQLDARTLQVHTEIERAVADVESGQARLDFARSSLGQAQTGLNLSQFGYARGALSVLDVISARSAVSAAQAEVAQSSAELAAAIARLKLFVGVPLSP